MQDRKTSATTKGGELTTGLPEEWKYQGVMSPNTTQVPDEFIDHLMPLLTGAEFKVLVYIVRRTFGFKKEADTISIDQMVNGIRKKNGEQLDYGTGLSRPTVVEAIRSLTRKNIILTEHRKSSRGGDLATTYRLNIKGVGGYSQAREGGVKKFNSPQGQENEQGGLKNLTPPRVKKSNPQHTDHEQHTEETTTTVTHAVPLAEKLEHPAPVVVAPQQSSPKKSEKQEPLPEVAQELVSAGVSGKVAKELAASFSSEDIRNQILALAHRKATEPAAVLVKSIRESWALPKQYERTITAAERQAREIVGRKEEELRERLVDEELEKLGRAEHEALEREARERAQRDCSFFAHREVSGAVVEGYVRLLMAERLGLSAEASGSGAPASASVRA